MSDPEMTTFGMYPEPEPVAWFCKLPDNKISIKIVGKPTEGNWEPLYTAPPKKEWVGLKDDDVNLFVDAIYKGFDMKPRNEIEIQYFERLIKFIDRKLKEKNS